MKEIIKRLREIVENSNEIIRKKQEILNEWGEWIEQNGNTKERDEEFEKRLEEPSELHREYAKEYYNTVHKILKNEEIDKIQEKIGFHFMSFKFIDEMEELLNNKDIEDFMRICFAEGEEAEEVFHELCECFEMSGNFTYIASGYIMEFTDKDENGLVIFGDDEKIIIERDVENFNESLLFKRFKA